jgi:hypothetical protein
MIIALVFGFAATRSTATYFIWGNNLLLWILLFLLGWKTFGFIVSG